MNTASNLSPNIESVLAKHKRKEKLTDAEWKIVAAHTLAHTRRRSIKIEQGTIHEKKSGSTKT